MEKLFNSFLHTVQNSESLEQALEDFAEFAAVLGKRLGYSDLDLQFEFRAVQRRLDRERAEKAAFELDVPSLEEIES